MGNASLTGSASASPSIFVKTKKKKFYFVKMKKRKPINFTSSLTQDTSAFNLSGEIEYAERQSSSNTCIRNEDETYCKIEPEQFFERYLASENTAPVVVTSSTFLHGSDYKCHYLPLGIILNALFRYDNWLYVRTAHGEEGYIADCMCLPLEAPFLSSNQTIEYNPMEFEQLESLYKWDFNGAINYNERNVDLLYLQINGIRRRERGHLESESGNKLIKLVIKNDFTSIVENTISVRRGDIVFLQHNRVVGWFWVKNEIGREGFIPIAIAGYLHHK